ncbi:MAG: cation:proton antiporter [Arcobacter sp.]|nr:cation:proton antiporter [Arcobacter sp.]
MHHNLLLVIVVLAISIFINVFLKKIKIPTIIGYITTGFIIASFYHFDIESKEFLTQLSEFGIVFLMFTIGLEFSINHLKKTKKEVFLFGFFQVFFTGLIFTLICLYLFEISIESSLTIGFALSLSSTAIVLKILNEKNELHSGYGNVVLGVLIFQDLAVIPVLIMLSIFTSNNQSLDKVLITLFINSIVVIVTFLIIGKYIIERYFKLITYTKSEEIFLISVLFLVTLTSFFAEQMGFSYSLGAFLAGMMLAETKYRFRIESDLVPFRDLLLGLFFITIGMQIDWHVALNYIFEILLITVAIISIKAFVVFMALYRFIQKRTVLKTTIALSQVGEFALVIFTLAYSSKIISGIENQILVVSVILSMILSPFMLKNIKNITDFFMPEPTILRKRAYRNGGFDNHMIICGYGPVGKNVAKSLKELGINYVILEHDIVLVDKAIASGEKNIFFANAAQKSVLEHFNVNGSNGVIVSIVNEKQKRLICENIVSIDKNINIVVVVNNENEEKILEDLDIKHIINDRDLISKLLVEKALTCQI